jgi:hypothetical protein
MTKSEKEICMTLICQAETKKAAFDAISVLFKNIKYRELHTFIESNWEHRAPKGKISMQNTEYKERVTILFSVFVKKKFGEIADIHLKLNKCLSKSTPHKFYEALIGKEKYNEPGREGVRGEWVRFIGFNEQRTLIQIQELHDRKRFYWFSVYDINLANYIELS